MVEREKGSIREQLCGSPKARGGGQGSPALYEPRGSIALALFCRRGPWLPVPDNDDVGVVAIRIVVRPTAVFALPVEVLKKARLPKRSLHCSRQPELLHMPRKPYDPEHFLLLLSLFKNSMFEYCPL